MRAVINRPQGAHENPGPEGTSAVRTLIRRMWVQPAAGPGDIAFCIRPIVE
jgi:hypothetical protein